MPADGQIDYIELPCPDIPASKRFYGAVFGWTFTDYGPDYCAFEGEKVGGGFNPARKVVREGGALVILYAKDLDAMEAKVKNAGATIIHRHDFPGGRRFHFRDPNGNEVAIWSET